MWWRVWCGRRGRTSRSRTTGASFSPAAPQAFTARTCKPDVRPLPQLLLLLLLLHLTRAVDSADGAAKNAMTGLARVLSVEGKRYHINVNVVCPAASSRMTDPTNLEVRRGLNQPLSVRPPTGHLVRTPRQSAKYVPMRCVRFRPQGGRVLSKKVQKYRRTTLKTCSNARPETTFTCKHL